ncbi:hypothetical protein MD484_g2120, partial [Candolleomyces efflorescens]
MLTCPECDPHLTGTSTSRVWVSPAPHLLETNEAPLPEEAASIGQCLPDVEDEIRTMESQISRVQSRLLMLQLKHEELKSFAHKHRGVLSPVRRLFPELLSEIFSWCPRGGPVQHNIVKTPDSFDPLHGPLLLAQICHSWRAVALTTPNLWTTIRIVLRPQSKHRIELLELFLSRSRDCDLTIGVTKDPKVSDLASFPLPELFILAQESHRWRVAIFYLPPYRMYWDPLIEAKGKTERLQHLGIYYSRGGSQDQVLAAFENSPQLASLGLSSHVSIGNLRFNRSTITHFRYEKVDSLMPFAPLEQCLEVLQSLPNLEHCVLDCIIYGPSPIGDIVMNRLKHLDIKLEFEPGSDENQASALWKALQLPNLSFLQVESHSPALFFGHIPFSHFVGRCRKLKELGIVLISAQAEQLLAILQSAVTIKSLALGLSKETFLPVLSSMSNPKGQSERLLPTLKTVRVYPVPMSTEYIPPIEFLAAFVQMAQERMTQVNSKGSKTSLLETGSLQYPLGVEAAAEAVKTSLSLMELKNPFPAQLYCLKRSPSGSLIRIQRS